MLELCRCPNIYGPDCIYVYVQLIDSLYASHKKIVNMHINCLLINRVE